MGIKSILLAATALILSTSVNAALVGRLAATPGGTDYQAYYDDVADLTWLADANAAAGSSFDDGLGGAAGDDFNTTDGLMTWASASAWAANLTVGGIDGWRLPSMDVDGDSITVSCSSVAQEACKDNEYGHLYRYGLDTMPASGITTVTPGPFTNILSSRRNYWSSTDLFGTGSDSDFIYSHNFETGGQNGSNKNTVSNFAWAVHSGDVSEVPIPAAAWLFGSGLIGLIGFARRNKS